MSQLDTFYRRLLLTGFFGKGWGKPEHMKRIFTLRRQIANRQVALQYVNPSHEVTIEKETKHKAYTQLHCSFTTPTLDVLDEELLPKECHKAHFELILPREETQYRPVCWHFAGTGDHFFWRRRKLAAIPLMEERGMASVIVENPFYGLRKPREQLRSSLRNVTDLFVMGASLILESIVLFNWCKRQGFGPIVSHGISLGGHLSTLTSTVLPEPVGIVPCLSQTSASLTFTEGVLAGAINWKLLDQQLRQDEGYRKEIYSMLESEKDAFEAGKDLVRKMDKVDRAEEKKINKEENQERAGIYASLDAIMNNLKTPVLQTLDRLPYSFSSSEDAELTEQMRKETFHFMRGIMDECTHLKNYSLPLDPTLCLSIAAERDAYMPRDAARLTPLNEVWPGSELRLLKGEGHVSSYIFKQKIFREAIYEVLDKLIEKNYANKH